MSTTWYNRHVLPYLLDFACSLKPIQVQRRSLIPLACGHVLEIGIGTGLNLAYYDRTRVERIVGLDPALDMHPLAAKRIQQTGLTVELVGLSAERIPFEAAQFDTVVITYSLCSIPDPLAALKEMHRVLKRQGRLIFCEHGAAPDASVRCWQDRLTPAWSRLAGGCQLNRDIPQLLRQAGFQPDTLEKAYLPGPRPLTYSYWGTATPRQ
ncbi:methyltransferase family protein [Pseudomonas duriflava]|uniref:Methyltransferase family protein n=1 Tax=Pseudomonas duriflava TaxID=459528 RepID=A0A562QL75_9PSED|nr:class I SAM-dependent methyltransferase [Pseudomonas duriflava]TWI57465.1 methyltransferase family protein [Pseudomonas duriflava]